MSGVKHTPGPWEAKRYPEGDCWHIHYGDKGGWLGEVYIDGDKNGAAADARLLAAAPCMFEYILSSAQNGCATAQEIVTRATGDRPEKGEQE